MARMGFSLCAVKGACLWFRQFVTLTPNTDNSFVVAQYTGVSSVTTFFEVLDAAMPTKTTLREASLGNDCVAARLLMRQVDAFITHGLGIDPTTKKPTRHHGLFGYVNAYFGMVETRGRGSLHIHFLIWVRDCPPNSVAVENILRSSKSDQFRASVAAYTHSIVKNELTIDLAQNGCCKCGTSYSHLVALPIPDSAHKDPQAGLRCKKSHSTIIEPVIVVNAKSNSAPYILYEILYSSVAHCIDLCGNMHSQQTKLHIKQRVEMTCRNTLQQALDVRMQTIFDLRIDLCKMDNDPFQNDYLTRLIEMIPPSPSDGRMSK
ncbi:LOW QUALITY PROTEIN: Hypothetical protein PHPALM_11796 [Phytophthora palmivora]|uniref:Helitron helicase-like domain-containing protein n=1 Tax=Phytophthora palmivora TaxID=4796 RepID=A0A2P4Y1D1_9STRA|nr:LOW QUALITY PROTEIN: Hypothetical protein PHPALM_11796 [Phytophthora palmivora]